LNSRVGTISIQRCREADLIKCGSDMLSCMLGLYQRDRIIVWFIIWSW